MKYVKINFKAFDFTQPLQSFMGSALRGAFGYSLKKIVCVNPSFMCRDCFARESCLYYNFYEKTNGYHNYRFDICLDSKEFDFNLFLFGEACEKLPYVASSIHKMLTETGIGKDRKISKNLNINVNGKIIFDGNNFSIPKDYIKLFKTEYYSPDIILKFITPFRSKKDNKLLKSNPPLELILSSVQNRKNQIEGKKMEKIDFTPIYDEVESKTYFKEQTRRSNRQKTKMQIGGIMGQIRYKNLDKKSYELLKLAEIIGIGKQTVMGLGKIKVEVDK